MNKNTTRKIAITGAALVSVFALSACSTPSDTASDGSTTLAHEDSGYSFEETVLIEAYESEYGDASVGYEGQIIDIGYSTCDALDAGVTFETIATTAYDSGMDMEEAGYIVGASVTAFCPEWTEYLMDTVSQYA